MRLSKLHRAGAGSGHNCMLSVLLALALSTAAVATRAQTAQRDLPPSPGGMIWGAVTVLSQQGEPHPLEGIRVELAKGPEDLQPLGTVTDSAGHYEFTQLAGGAYTVRVGHKGFRPFAAAVPPGAHRRALGR